MLIDLPCGGKFVCVFVLVFVYVVLYCIQCVYTHCMPRLALTDVFILNYVSIDEPVVKMCDFMFLENVIYQIVSVFKGM